MENSTEDDSLVQVGFCLTNLHYFSRLIYQAAEDKPQLTNSDDDNAPFSRDKTIVTFIDCPPILVLAAR